MKMSYEEFIDELVHLAGDVDNDIWAELLYAIADAVEREEEEDLLIAVKAFAQKQDRLQSSSQENSQEGEEEDTITGVFILPRSGNC